MTTSPTTTKLDDRRAISRGELAYVCARNQSQAHDLLVRTVRKSGLTQKELAKLTGIDEATVSRILRRPTNLEINTFSKLMYGARGAMLTFGPFFPKRRAYQITYLVNKAEDNTASRFFGYRQTRAVSASTKESSFTYQPSTQPREVLIM